MAKIPGVLLILVLAISCDGNTAAFGTVSACSGRQTWRNRSHILSSCKKPQPFAAVRSWPRRRQRQHSLAGGSVSDRKRPARGCLPLLCSPSSSSASPVEDLECGTGSGSGGCGCGGSGKTVSSRSEKAAAAFEVGGDDAPDSALHLAAVSAAAGEGGTASAGAASAAASALLEDGKRSFFAPVGRWRQDQDPSARLMMSMRQLSLLSAAAGLVAVAFDYKHGLAGFHWFQDWAGGAAPHFSLGVVAGHEDGGGPGDSSGGGLGNVHFTPLKSMASGLGAGFTRALSRVVTFPLDTVKTRSQLSRLGAEGRALLPEKMCRVIDGPVTFDGVFKGFSAFLVQAGPSNAMFFLFYDALKEAGAAIVLGGGLPSPVPPAVLHLGASSIATVPSNLVRTPAEVVKQRLQVGQESGNSLQVLLSIVRAEGVKGIFVGAREQLMREIPFNAIQFTVYECLKSSVGSSGLWADAALGAASSAAGALATQPVDTVKTRVMTKSVPGSFGGPSPGFLESASRVAEAEGASALYLGLLPRLVLVSTGGAFYFWGQEFVAQLISRVVS